MPQSHWKKFQLNRTNFKSSNTITSCKFFRRNWISWKILGVSFPPPKRNENDEVVRIKQNAYLLWAVVAHVVATLLMPVHLGWGILEATDKSMLFEAVSITVTSIGCSIKTLLFMGKIYKIKEMERIIGKLDERVISKDEKVYFDTVIRRNVAQVENMFTYVYLTVAIASTIGFAFSTQKRLIYAGGFPLDWHHSRWAYASAVLYQLLASYLQFLQNYTNDSFPPKALCLLSGHINLLHMRISKIGYDTEEEAQVAGLGQSTTLWQQEQELIECIRDQKNLYKLFDTMQDIISWPMFMQIFVTVVNNCVALAALLFFVTDPIARIYYVFYIFGVAMQIFPTCYYGSDVATAFGDLHYAVFSTNWPGQTRSYKRNMLIFIERTLRQNMPMAGNMFPIHVDTFFAACKGAYSLFAVIMTMNE